MTGEIFDKEFNFDTRYLKEAKELLDVLEREVR
jgi:hypothetical protein